MKNATHTPGPWIRETEHEMLPGVIRKKPDSGTPVGGVLADVRGCGPIACANARLIAAAPDMLAALCYMDKWLAETNYDTDHPWRVSIRAAIAKAKGRS